MKKARQGLFHLADRLSDRTREEGSTKRQDCRFGRVSALAPARVSARDGANQSLPLRQMKKARQGLFHLADRLSDRTREEGSTKRQDCRFGGEHEKRVRERRLLHGLFDQDHPAVDGLAKVRRFPVHLYRRNLKEQSNVRRAVDHPARRDGLGTVDADIADLDDQRHRCGHGHRDTDKCRLLLLRQALQLAFEIPLLESFRRSKFLQRQSTARKSLNQLNPLGCTTSSILLRSILAQQIERTWRVAGTSGRTGQGRQCLHSSR